MLAAAIRSALAAPAARAMKPPQRTWGPVSPTRDPLGRLLAAKRSPMICSKHSRGGGRPTQAFDFAGACDENRHGDRSCRPTRRRVVQTGRRGRQSTRVDRALMPGLLFEVRSKPSGRELYTTARSAAPLRGGGAGELFVSPPSERQSSSLHEASLDDARSSALIVLEAATTPEDPEATLALKEPCQAPSLPSRLVAERGPARAASSTTS